MRLRLALVLVVILLVPIHANAGTNGYENWPTDASSYTWDEAMWETVGGTIGGLALPLSTNSTDASVTMEVSDFPQIIEVYTATWCTNCVQTEGILNQVIDQSDVMLINYHKFKFEPEDPFGSNGTDNRWEAIYGDTSERVGFSPRLAPTTVFDGERLHVGTRAKSSNLSNDYSASISVGSSHPYSGTASFSLSRSSESSPTSVDFSWDLNYMSHDCGKNCQPYTLTPWIMFIEQVASFPEGSNGKGNYSHILRDTIQLPNLQGEISADLPEPWDGDDMSAILVIDWNLPNSDDSTDRAIPAPGVSTLICLLATLVPRRNNHMHP